MSAGRPRSSSATALGAILLAGAVLFAGGEEYALRRDRAAARWELGAAAGAPADDPRRLNAEYHLAHAVRSAALRWSLAGHGTLGLLAAGAGLALLVVGTRRPAVRPPYARGGPPSR